MRNLTALPAGLPACLQYINWKPVPKPNGKTDKIPIDLAGNDLRWREPSNWLSAADAWRSPFNTHGIGFVITPGWFVIDLDNCREGGGWSALANELCAQLPGAYVDVTPSGNGLRIICRGVLPDGHKCRFVGGEVYSLARFVTITGTHARGDAAWDAQHQVPWLVERLGLHPEVIEAFEYPEGRDPLWRGPTDDAELITLMLNQPRNSAQAMMGANAADVWLMNEDALAQAWPAEDRSDGLPFDYNRADLSMMNHLAYFTGRDLERMERLFKQWPGYREWKHQGRRGYHTQKCLARASTNRRVLGDKRTAAVEAVMQTTAPQRRPYGEIESDIKALGAFASNGGGTFIDSIKPLMLEMIISDLDEVEVDMLLGEISKASGKQLTKGKLNAAFKKLKVEVGKQQKTATAIAQGVRHEVLAELIKIDEMVLPNIANAEIYIRAHPEWDGVLGYDEFSHTVVVRAPLPWSSQVNREWVDADTTHLNIWLQRRCEGMRSIGRHVIEHLPDHIARINPFHAVRDYLGSLVWDGLPRLNGFAEGYLGAVAEDVMQQHYLQSVCPRFFIGAVARVMQPGCKMDTALILESDMQGFKKSTLFRALAVRDDWFSDTALEIGSKDGMQQLNGVWIYEMAELEAVDRKSVNANKQFMASQFDKFRPPYGRRVEKFMRQCVLVGSTNNQEYLRDKTGNRRYWPVTITARINLDFIRRDIHQLWAEAVHRYRMGEQWWFTDHEEIGARREQDDRLPHDDMTKEVLDAASMFRQRLGIDRITLDQLSTELKFTGDGKDLRFKGRIADVLKRHGFRAVRPRVNNPTRERYFIYPTG